MSYRKASLGDSLFSRRSFILVILKCLIFLIITARLFFLQIMRASEYRTLSDRNKIKFLLLEPKRGLIFDRNNVLLAENKVNYRLFFYKQRNHNFSKILEEVFLILKLPTEQRKALYNTVGESNYIYPVVIEENLSWVQVARIKANLYKLPGVYVEKGHTRFYSLADICVHAVGYIGAPTSNDIKKYKLFHNKEFKVGKSGIEKTFDQSFVGQFGDKKVEINAHRVVVRELSYKRSTAGQDVVSSLDSRLQQFVYDSISKDGAAAIVVDAKDGGILSMVSTPTFDPNIFTNSISRDKWNKIITNKSYPLTNKALGKLYPPGSIWKIIVALALLREGIDPHKKIYCSGSVDVGDRVYRCWKKQGHGYVDLNKALACSCNCYFYEIAPTIGIDNIYNTASILGFGNKIGVELPGELFGINPNKPWKKRVYGEDWLVGDTVNASIGQGYNSVTLIQLATMMTRLVSGKKIVPSLILSNENNATASALNIPEEHLHMVRESLSNVFNRPYGIGYKLKIPQKELMMGGKTGTAQVISQDASSMVDRSLRSHSIFAGFAPIHDPKYVVAVVVDNAGWGTGAAASLGREILYFAQNSTTKV
jgi:penicillin-binding protein 2